jgi:hypothetical protein
VTAKIGTLCAFKGTHLTAQAQPVEVLEAKGYNQQIVIPFGSTE